MFHTLSRNHTVDVPAHIYVCGRTCRLVSKAVIMGNFYITPSFMPLRHRSDMAQKTSFSLSAINTLNWFSCIWTIMSSSTVPCCIYEAKVETCFSVFYNFPSRLQIAPVGVEYLQIDKNLDLRTRIFLDFYLYPHLPAYLQVIRLVWAKLVSHFNSILLWIM